MIPRVLAVATVLAATAATAASADPGEPRLRLADAQAMAARAERAATAQGTPMSIVIVNREGRVILSERMDEAAFQSIGVAEAKAVTAGGHGVATSEIEKAVAAGATSLLSIHSLIAVAGGVPIVRDGKLIGGIGVSGGSGEQDEHVAQIGAGVGAVPPRK